MHFKTQLAAQTPFHGAPSGGGKRTRALTWPCLPRPHDQSCPLSEMASVWLAPQATDTMRVRCSEVMARGTPTSMGVHPPCPSSPLLARPQV